VKTSLWPPFAPGLLWRYRRGDTLVIDRAFVEQQLSGIAKNADLSRYVL
jgi:hypothetical protein